jgi:ribosomal protein L37AE/L43A
MPTSTDERRIVYLERKERGYCPRCGNKVKGKIKTTYCEECKKYFSNYNKENSETINKIFGGFIEKYFDRINGQIKIKDIKNYVGKFGEKYLTKFNTKLENRNSILLRTHHNDIQAVYGNLIICRHKFIHANNHTMTFNEVVQSYSIGKEIINILNDTMKR